MKLHPKTPLSFVLVLLLNIVLAVALEIALLYRIPSPLSPEALETFSTRYENCRVYGPVNLDTGGSGVHFYRVQTRDGETDIIPLRQHSFFPSRARLQENKILKNADLTVESTRQVMIGTKLYAIFISDGSVHAGAMGGTSSLSAALTKYLGLGAVLAFFELLLLEKLRGNQ